MSQVSKKFLLSLGLGAGLAGSITQNASAQMAMCVIPKPTFPYFQVVPCATPGNKLVAPTLIQLPSVADQHDQEAQTDLLDLTNDF